VRDVEEEAGVSGHDDVWVPVGVVVVGLRWTLMGILSVEARGGRASFMETSPGSFMESCCTRVTRPRTTHGGAGDDEDDDAISDQGFWPDGWKTAALGF